MPVRINLRYSAGLIQLHDLFRCEVPSDRTQILAELVLIASADDYGCDRRTLQEPVEGDLWDGFASLGGNLVQSVHDSEQQLIGDLWTKANGDRALETTGWKRLATPDAACQPAPPQRAPDDAADALIESERHQFPLVLPAHEGIIGLMRHVARPPVPRRHCQRLHQVPARKIRAAHVANLAGGHQIVEGAEGLFDRCGSVEAVKLKQVDIVRTEAA